MGAEEHYPAHLRMRHLAGEADRPDGSGRSDFQRDRDRVLYSSAFRALGLKTQVVAATEVGYLHNRLTHTLKVAQIGRSIASRLASAGAQLDPSLVETACVAHDIGHPPFGHAGEHALNHAVEALRRDELKLRPGEEPAVALDGFEGNAQNLRVLTRLATHRDFQRPGLHLTRGALAAATKYPWTRGTEGKQKSKWGAYEGDREALAWILDGSPPDLRPVETDLMDWADDVTYAVHDVEDWYRLGLIPLDRLFRFDCDADNPNAGRDEPPELRRFLTAVERKWAERGIGFDRQEIVRMLHVLSDRISVEEPFDGTRRSKGRLQLTVSDLICFFADYVTYEGRCCAYDGKIVIPEDRRVLCDVLKELVWYYVIDRPTLGAQQHGQSKIVEELVKWYAEATDLERLLPEDRMAEYGEHGDRTRVIADHVASLTEPMAMKLHGKFSGTDMGAITDRVF